MSLVSPTLASRFFTRATAEWEAGGKTREALAVRAPEQCWTEILCDEPGQAFNPIRLRHIRPWSGGGWTCGEGLSDPECVPWFPWKQSPCDAQGHLYVGFQTLTHSQELCSWTASSHASPTPFSTQDRLCKHVWLYSSDAEVVVLASTASVSPGKYNANSHCLPQTYWVRNFGAPSIYS